MAIGVLALLVDVEVVMRVLDERDPDFTVHERGISFSISVVLPLPEKPAKPKINMAAT